MRGGARGRSRGVPRYPRPMLEPCYLPPGSCPDIYGYPAADAGDEGQGAGAGARGGSTGPGLTNGASSVAAKEEAAALLHRNRTCGASAAVCEHAKQCQPKFSKQSRGNCGPLAPGTPLLHAHPRRTLGRHAGLQGRAVQLNPMNPELKAPVTHLLTLNHDAPLSTFAFNSNLRHHSKECVAAAPKSCDGADRKCTARPHTPPLLHFSAQPEPFSSPKLREPVYP